MKDRSAFVDYLNEHNMLGEVAEIGVAEGKYLQGNLQRWKGKIYYAVDVWEWYENMDGGHFVKFTKEMFDGQYNLVQEMQKADARIHIMKMKSVDAAKLINDNSLDWIFIDANHTYQGVFEDLQAWWPKIKLGGIFSGHDFNPRFNGLCLAVQNFMNEHGLKLSLTEDGDNWYTIKQ